MTEGEAHRALTADRYLAQAFEVLDLSVRPAPVRPDDIFEKVLHDSNKYAEKYVGYIRAFGDSSLRTQLWPRMRRQSHRGQNAE